MRWQRGTSDADIEDRRDQGGGGGFFPGGGLRLGLGGFLVLAVLSLIFKQNFFSLLDDQSGGAPPASVTAPTGPAASLSPAEEERYELVKFVINDTQDTWTRLLPAEAHVPYEHTKLVLFRDAIDSACGLAESASGPFYCPTDRKVYIDLSFYDELKSRFGASGDFAEAYVIAHEVGHHVQNLLGIEQSNEQGRLQHPGQANALSVQLELQADCLAGVWGKSSSRDVLEQGDVETGLAAAAAIGDDRIQRMAGRAVQPERFTHGSSAQRVAWFRRGLDGGTLASCGATSRGRP